MQIAPEEDTFFGLSQLAYLLSGLPIILGSLLSIKFIQDSHYGAMKKSIRSEMKFNYVLKQIEESILIINKDSSNSVFEYANDHFLVKFDALIRSLLPTVAEENE